MPDAISDVRAFSKCSGSLPKSDAFRNTYAPAVFSLHMSLLREIVRDRPVSLIVDETGDCLRRPTLNVIIQLVVKGKVLCILAASRRLLAANNVTLRKFLDCALQRLSVPWAHIMAIASDSASYNVTMMEVLHQTVPQVLHVRCIAHLFHNAVVEAVSSQSAFVLAAKVCTDLCGMLRASRNVRYSWKEAVRVTMRVEPRDPPKFYNMPRYSLRVWP